MSERVEGRGEEQEQAPAPGGAPARGGGPGRRHGGSGGRGGHAGPAGRGGRCGGWSCGAGRTGSARACCERTCGGHGSAKGLSPGGKKKQEPREYSCKLFFRKTSRNWATAATLSP